MRGLFWPAVLQLLGAFSWGVAWVIGIAVAITVADQLGIAWTALWCPA